MIAEGMKFVLLIVAGMTFSIVASQVVEHLARTGKLPRVVNTWKAIYALCKVVELRARKQ